MHRQPHKKQSTAVTATVHVELQQACDVASLPDAAEMQSWVGAAVCVAGDGASPDYELVVRVVGEEEIRDLNYRYRQKNSTTNVLAFPAGQSGVPGLPPEPRPTLGDLVICGPVVEREAREQGKSAASHWGHLLVHGTLHLLGYDHQTEAEAAVMESLEARIMAGRGFDDPYA